MARRVCTAMERPGKAIRRHLGRSVGVMGWSVSSRRVTMVAPVHCLRSEASTSEVLLITGALAHLSSSKTATGKSATRRNALSLGTQSEHAFWMLIAACNASGVLRLRFARVAAPAYQIGRVVGISTTSRELSRYLKSLWSIAPPSCMGLTLISMMDNSLVTRSSLGLRRSAMFSLCLLCMRANQRLASTPTIATMGVVCVASMNPTTKCRSATRLSASNQKPSNSQRCRCPSGDVFHDGLPRSFIG